MREINLGLGSPCDPAPELASARFIKEMQKPGGLGYAPVNGVQEARETLCWWQETQFGVKGLNPGKDYDGTPKSVGNVTYAEGSRLLLVSAFEAFFQPGNQVVLPSRYYNGHMDAVRKFGLRPTLVPIPSASTYVDGIEDALRSGSRPKAVVTCFVSNPTGISCQVKDYIRLVALAHTYGFIILDDYAYGALDYIQGYVPSVLAVPGALDVVLWFGTASKMFSAAGCWKTGFAIGSQDRIALLTETKKIYSEGGSIPGQLATATSFRECGDDVIRTREMYRHRAELTTDLLRQAGLTGAVIPDGGMFGWYPVNGYQGSANRLVVELSKRNVIVREDLIYGGQGTHIRWCFRVPDEDTHFACEAVYDVLSQG